MKKTVLILADAFRHDYLDRGITPFLDKEKRRGHYVKRITPGNGFCERAEIFTGKHPIETGFFTAIDLSKEANIYSRFSFILHIIDFLLKVFNSSFLKKVLRRLIWEIVSRTKHPMHPYKIPLKALKYFSLTEDKVDMRKKGALGFPSIFDFIEEKGSGYFYDSFTALNIAQRGDDQFRLNLALQNAEEDYGHYFIYLSALDSVGHKYGPDSTEINDAIEDIDKKIESFVREFEKKSPNTNFIILGDHGMVTVKKTIDALSVIKKVVENYPIRIGRDYFYFLDSTLVRIWIKDKKYRSEVLSALTKSDELQKNGQFITRENAKDFQIPFNQDSPHLLWWANPGVLVSPDFFHSEKEAIKGMHGYDNSFDSSKGFCLVKGKDVEQKLIEQEDLTSLFKKLKGDLN